MAYKKELFFTLRTSFGRYDVIGVTTEKNIGSYRHAYYGRDQYGATHVSARDCVGRFATKELAAAQEENVKAIRANAKEKRKPFEAACSAVDTEERAAIKALFE